MDRVLWGCIIIFGITIFVSALIVTIISLANRIDVRKYTESEELKTDFIFMKSVRKCNIWLSISVLWLVVEYLIVILPFELTAAILYLEHIGNEANRTFIILLSIFSLACVIISSVVRPHDHMQGYRKAYVELDNAINKYIGEKSGDDTILIDALHAGECFISRGYNVDCKYKKMEQRADNRGKNQVRNCPDEES